MDVGGEAKGNPVRQDEEKAVRREEELLLSSVDLIVNFNICFLYIFNGKPESLFIMSASG